MKGDAVSALLSALFDELFPILRSITGPGYKQSLSILQRHVPFELLKVASGTRVFDWIVPQEWCCRSARLTAPDGKIIADMAVNNLHVLNYSTPIDVKIPLEELQNHLYSLPKKPTAIPYVISYYSPKWGFCISENVRKQLDPGIYHAKIDSSFCSGSLVIGEAVLPGDCQEEILLTSYLCHPSLANNELSGPLVLTALYLLLSAKANRRFTYRFVIHPETIGALSYLYLRGEYLREHLAAGLVLTCLGGDAASLSFKLSRKDNCLVNRLARHWAGKGKLRLRKFDPADGSDERQYCSPGFNLPMGQMARTVYDAYTGYHNSLDDKSFMGIDAVMKSTRQLMLFLEDLEHCTRYERVSPFGEPQLGKYGLYPSINCGGKKSMSPESIQNDRELLNRMLYILNYSDGIHDLLDIAELSGYSLELLVKGAVLLENKGLLQKSANGL